jgi:two-component system OmpR family response regulator
MDRKVLIVDDNETCCEAIRYVLEAAGANVYAASDAPAAETLFRILVPSLVILDVRMPGMSGLELIGRLRSFVGWEHVPVIVASALDRAADRIAAFNAGADGYLAKPFSARELRAMARRFLPLAKTGALPAA